MRHPLFYDKLDPNAQYLLEEHFNFYHKSNEHQRKLFDHRVVNFIAAKEFYGREGLIIDEPMKLLIAGTAVMLSFGFDNYKFEMFDKILIYPEDYYSQLTQLQHKGETNPGMGIMAFSWQDFEEGLKIKDDNLHLGLHEFAHALHFGFLRENSTEAYEFQNNFDQMINLMDSESIKNKLIQSEYFRSYAFENKFEFFAIAVEHFYESPYSFLEKNPELFKVIGDLLQIGNIMN